MTDEGTDGNPAPLSGNIEPAGEGEWLTLEDAGQRLGIDRKSVYRRIRRGQMVGRKAPFKAHLEVWFPSGEPGHPDQGTKPPATGSLAVPDDGERFLILLDRATASLGKQIQELTEEREQAYRERDQERSRAESESERADRAEARLLELEGRRWWERLWRR